MLSILKYILGDVGNSAQGMVKVGPPLPTSFPKTQSERIYLNVISFQQFHQKIEMKRHS